MLGANGGTSIFPSFTSAVVSTVSQEKIDTQISYRASLDAWCNSISDEVRSKAEAIRDALWNASAMQHGKV